MYPVFCNKCFAIKIIQVTQQFYISKCGHMFCATCKVEVCPVCGRPYTGILIAADMPSSMASYFENPLKAYKHFQKVVQFQAQQDALFLNYCVNVLPKRKIAAERTLNGLTRISTHLTEKLAEKKRRLAKMKAYLAYHKRRAEQPTGLEPPTPNTIRRRRYGAPVIVDNANALRMTQQRMRPSPPTTPSMSSASRTVSSLDSFEKHIKSFASIEQPDNVKRIQYDFTL